MVIKKGYNRVMNSRAAMRMIAFIAAGLVLISAAMIEGLRYSPDGDPGAVGIMVWLGLAGLACWAVPGVGFIALAVRGVREERRRLLAAGFTPAQIAIAEAVAMEGAHLAWRAHNQKVSDELSASVMGDRPWHPSFGTDPGQEPDAR